MELTESTESSEQIMEPDEVELTLRRFAMEKNDQALTKLLNSMFPTASDSIKHETSSTDKVEDSKE